MNYISLNKNHRTHNKNHLNMSNEKEVEKSKSLTDQSTEDIEINLPVKSKSELNLKPVQEPSLNSEDKLKKHVRISEEIINLKTNSEKEKVVFENNEVLYVVQGSEPDSKNQSKTSSVISLAQTISNFSFYNTSKKKKKEVNLSNICKCSEKFTICKEHSFVPSTSTSSDDTIAKHTCSACRCVNCPLKHNCWFLKLYFYI